MAILLIFGATQSFPSYGEKWTSSHSVCFLNLGPRLRSTLRYRFLETLGAASLPVFCGRLVIVLLALAVAGDQKSESRSGVVSR